MRKITDKTGIMVTTDMLLPLHTAEHKVTKDLFYVAHLDVAPQQLCQRSGEEVRYFTSEELLHLNDLFPPHQYALLLALRANR